MSDKSAKREQALAAPAVQGKPEVESLDMGACPECEAMGYEEECIICLGTGEVENMEMSEQREMTKKTNPLDDQVGGGHYKDFPIQPFEYNQRNGLPFGEGCVVKYVSRHKQKNGIEDLRKAKHFLELIALITYGEEL